jgi:hypothetical protein
LEIASPPSSGDTGGGWDSYRQGVFFGEGVPGRAKMAGYSVKMLARKIKRTPDSPGDSSTP